ncbi:TrmH family RNA methyltransferase [Mycoplasma sp. HU2014]|uniref:TrmH family RNA methyltransferase n=1 Tax=Mycoplasma sp. HU2014 TaxID=1664275 RepID=UPI00067D0469|nr:RNA methyltransferase [Mycoplasma sp. HU2014]KNG79804.1 TrmH family RNA methyltransferase [Mycoplasma sp. HU2014]MBY7704611.1 RNA methyltransferase [Vibrio harveyi]
MEKITSTTNQKIKDILKLKDSKHRNSKKLFIVEGFHMVLEAYNHKIIKTLLATEKALSVLKDEIPNIDEVIEISSNVAKKLSETTTSQEVFAVCSMDENPVIDLENDILLLDQIQDPGNLGTLIRSAASFNFKTIIASPNSAGFYNQKVLRSTQGNLFKVNLFNEYLIKVINILHENNYIIVGTSLHHNAKPLQKIKFDSDDKYALIIGNESKGISPELLNLIDVNVKIEMQEDVDSLNAAVAGSIIMYEINNAK